MKKYLVALGLVLFTSSSFATPVFPYCAESVLFPKDFEQCVQYVFTFFGSYMENVPLEVCEGFEHGTRAFEACVNRNFHKLGNWANVKLSSCRDSQIYPREYEHCLNKNISKFE